MTTAALLIAVLAADLGLTVKVDGPQVCVVGKAVRLKLVEVGPVDSREWSIDPPVEDIFISADETQLAFTTPIDGDYQVTVSVAGIVDGKARSAHATYRVTMLARESVEETPSAQRGVRSARALDPVDVVRRAARAVVSDDRMADAQIVAAALRDIAASKSNGNLLAEARALSAGALPDGGHAWRSFWADLDDMFAEFQDQRLLPTRAHKAAALRKVAEILAAGEPGSVRAF